MNTKSWLTAKYHLSLQTSLKAFPAIPTREHTAAK